MDANAKKTIIMGVKAAGKRLVDLFNEKKGPVSESKASRYAFDYKIPADKETEKIILDSIKRTGLKCEIVSEESDIMTNEDAEYRIYIDPLDGTVNFSRGIPIFCIGMGIFYKNVPYLGVVYDPTRDEIFIAEKGKGISVNGKIIRPQVREDKILVNLEWYGAESYERTVSKLKKANIRAVTAGSGVLALCYGSVGRGDGAILVENSPWDIAPGLVMAREAGHVIKEIDGSEVNLNKRRISIIAAPDKIFEKIEKALR